MTNPRLLFAVLAPLVAAGVLRADLRVAGGSLVAEGGEVVVGGEITLAAATAVLVLDGGGLTASSFSGMAGSRLRVTSAGDGPALNVGGELDIGGVALELDAIPVAGRFRVLARYANLAGGTFAAVSDLPAENRIDYAFDDGTTPHTVSLVEGNYYTYRHWALARGLTVGQDDDFADDPNHDGMPNAGHFAFGTDPLSGGSGGAAGGSPFRVTLSDDGGQTYLTYTFPVRTGASFDARDQPTADTVGGLVYRVFGDDNLSGEDVPVVERTLAVDPGDLPTLGDYDDVPGPDWEYRSFRLTVPSGLAPALPQGFLWATATEEESSVAGRIATAGAVVNDVPAGSDTYFGVPLRGKVAFEGTIAAAGDVAQGKRIVLDEAGDLEPDVLAGGYYLRVVDGSHAGEYFTVVANDETGVTVDALGDPLAGLGAGDRVRVVRYRTLGELWPPATQTALVPSAGNFSFQRKSEVLFPDLAGMGIKRALSRRFFIAGGQWREDAAGFPNADAVALPPDTFLVVRQPATAGSRVFAVAGTVEPGTVSSWVFAEAAQDNDNHFAQPRPVAVRLDALGLESVMVASAGNFSFQRKDEVLIWDNAELAQKKAPARRFFLVGGSWREDTAGFPSADAAEFAPGAAFILRKKAAGTARTETWSQEPGF